MAKWGNEPETVLKAQFLVATSRYKNYKIARNTMHFPPGKKIRAKNMALTLGERLPNYCFPQ